MLWGTTKGPRQEMVHFSCFGFYHLKIPEVHFGVNVQESSFVLLAGIPPPPVVSFNSIELLGGH